jgi:hypothetical protein
MRRMRKLGKIAKMGKVRRIVMTLGIALAGLTGFKTTIQQQKSAAAEAAFVAKANKKHNHKVKKISAADEEQEDEIDINTDLGFYKAILRELGVKETKEKIKFLMAWRQGEGGKAKNNPFNTSKHIPGTVDSKYNSHGVRNYPNRKTGLDATVATLRLSHYKEIVELLKKDTVTALELARTKALKKWGTGEMVKKVLAGGKVNPPPIVS